MNKVSAGPKSLGTVLAKATPGSRVFLAPGDYGDVSFSKTVGVTLASGDPARPAIFRSINATECEGLALDGLAVELTPDAKTLAHTSAVRIYKSKGVALRRLVVRCGAAVVGVALDADPNLSRAAVGDNVRGLPTGRGITVDQSSDILVEGCELTRLHKGVVLNKASGVVIRGCDIGEVRTSPIVGTGLGAVTIAANRLHTARPWNFGGKGDHGDFIHFWTAKGDAAPGRISIVDNLIDQGEGAAILGIFLEDNLGIGYPDVEIARNVILNGNGQGIAIGNAKAHILDNLLLQTSGTVKQAPSILLRGASVIEARGNTTHDVYGTLRKLAPPSVAAKNRTLPGGVRPAKELEEQRAAWIAKHRASPVPPAAYPGRRAAFEAWDQAVAEAGRAVAFLRSTEA